MAFSPRTTREVQFDEKWAFVAKKEKHCDRDDPADDHKGDYWDHVAFDPEHRLVVSVVPGARTIENTEALVADFHRRTGGRVMNLMTSDEYPAYETAILHAYGETVTPPRTGKPGRPKAPYQAPPPGLTYATVHKTAGEGPGGRGRHPGGLRDDGGGAGGVGRCRRSAGRSTRRSWSGRTGRTATATRGRRGRRTASRRTGGIHEAVTYFTLVQLQLLLAGADAAIKDDQGRRVRADPGDGGRADRSRLVDPRMADLPAVQRC